MIIVDDIIDTAGTVVAISKRLSAMGAKDVWICASHGLFMESALANIEESPISNVIVTDSLPLPYVEDMKTQFTQVSMVPVLARVILSEHYRTRLVVDDSHHDHDEV